MDIEEVVVTHPDVLEVAVFSMPSDEWAEAPMPVVVLKPGCTSEATILKVSVNERVRARYQQLQDVVILSEFPRNAAGKTLNRVMRAEYWQDRAALI